MADLKSLFITLLVGFVFADEGGVIKPSCFTQRNSVSCCLGVGIKGQNYKTCIELAFRPNEMKGVATLRFNNRLLDSKDAAVGKVCSPLPPPLSTLEACLNVYWANLNVNQKLVDVCFVVEIQPLLQLRFDCFRLQNGRFQHHSEHPPEKHAVVNIGWANGKPSFVVHAPKLTSNITA